MAPATEELLDEDVSVFPATPGKRGPRAVEEMQGSLALPKRPRLTVLMADDDFDDCLLAREAWEELQTDHVLRFVHDGQELLDYVYHQGGHKNSQAAPSPSLILLDLNMPKKNGREVLKVLKADPRWRTIPIIVFTTSKNMDHIIQTYQDGSNAFMAKPTSYEGYVNALKSIELFWLTLAEIPVL